MAPSEAERRAVATDTRRAMGDFLAAFDDWAETGDTAPLLPALQRWNRAVADLVGRLGVTAASADGILQQVHADLSEAVAESELRAGSPGG